MTRLTEKPAKESKKKELMKQKKKKWRMTHYITHSWEVKKVKDREATTEQEEAAAHFYKMGFMGVDEKEAQKDVWGENGRRHKQTPKYRQSVREADQRNGTAGGRGYCSGEESLKEPNLNISTSLVFNLPLVQHIIFS